MAERREYQGAAVVTKLSTDITSSVLALTILSATGWPTGATGPFTLVVDPGTSNEEKIKCLSRSGSTITIAPGGRGSDATVASAHKAPAVVKHILGAYDIDLVNKHAADTTQDDHTQYMHNTVARTVVANHNFTGAPVFSGAPSFTGNPVFTGSPNFANATPNMGSNWGDATQMSSATPGSTQFGGSVNKFARIDHRHNIDIATMRDAILPVGMIFMSPHSNWGNPYFFCNGQAISRTSYPALFAVIGTLYGAGDGSTTYNLPDLRDRVAVGSGGSVHPNIGATGGQSQYTLSTSNLPPHAHDMSHGHSTNEPPHSHGPGGSGGATGFVFATSGNEQNSIGVAHNGGGYNQVTGVAFTGISNAVTGLGVNNFNGSTGNQGGGAAFSIEQAYMNLNFIIKAA